MYGVNEKRAKVNGVTFATHGKAFVGEDTSLRAEAGTTGFRGGDRKSGSRAYISLKDLGLTDCLFLPIKDKGGNPCGVEVAVCGDEAIDSLIRAMLFLTDALVDGTVGEGD